MKVNLRYKITKDYTQLSDCASDILLQAALNEREATFVTAAGSTPKRTYEMFCQKYKAEGLAPDRIRIVLLDEWCGLPFGHPSSCYAFIKDTLIKPLNIPHDNFIYFNSACKDTEAECARMQKILEGLKISVCVLGTGLNGHIGFNEPSRVFYANVHYTHLSATSLAHPMAQGNAPLITGGITLGIRNILAADTVLMLANGVKKRKHIQLLVNTNTISPQHPLTCLKLHKNAICIVDQSCA